ncbi:MAG: ribbon-helix-helix domain-containing protein [Hyphomicrobiaceae bacterium]|nr:ribbon-helix-helix domain-containing protein [Hyphomicrobiaceae bacterium]
MTGLAREAADFSIVLPPTAGRPAKRSFSIRGHRTSISIEAPFWDALTAIADDFDVPVARIVAAIDAVRGSAGLSSAIRVFVLQYYRNRGGPDSMPDQ